MVCDAKPIGVYTKEEIVKLEHKYRLLLKKSGFQDIEMWSNYQNKKVKRIKFIKGHIRFNRNNHTKNVYKTFTDKSISIEHYINIVSLFAYHSPDVLNKFKDILQDYSLTGNLALSIRNTKSTQSHESVSYYIKKNLPKMIEFVNKEFRDE